MPVMTHFVSTYYLIFNIKTVKAEDFTEFSVLFYQRRKFISIVTISHDEIKYQLKHINVSPKSMVFIASSMSQIKIYLP